MRKKLLLAVTLTLLLCLVPVSSEPFKNEATARGDIKVIVHGVPLLLSAPAYIEKGVTLVPVREISEAIGAKVQYNDNDHGLRTVAIERGDRSALVTIGSTIMTANGKSIQLEAVAVLIDGVTFVPLRALSEALGTVVAWDGINRIITIEEPARLPTIDTAEKLHELIESAALAGRHSSDSLSGIAISMNQAVNSESMASNGTSAQTAVSGDTAASFHAEGDATEDYSKTNIQTDGVDEADWAKTDGRFIYQISGSRVLITDIANPDHPRLAANLEYGEKDSFRPLELYIDDKRLVVIGQQSHIYAAYDGDVTDSSVSISKDVSLDTNVNVDVISPPIQVKKSGIAIPILQRHTVKTYIYELKEDGQPLMLRETEQEGSYLSSRKVDSAVYIVTNKHNYMHTIIADEQANAQLISSFEPIYSDTAASNKPQSLTLDKIHYFPNSVDSSMMLIGAFDLDLLEQPYEVSAYLGAGQTIYASQKHLYVALSKFNAKGDTYEQHTQFHKFRLDQGHIVYVGEGSVPGALLNQFSMDEYDGYFRVALTKGDMWASGEAGSTNNIYILDEKMNTVGQLEGLAPGERIYSVRFMGRRAYLVTFRNVDPLFVVDLYNPTNPAVLGQLKIPGYSDYLHPYDEHHLLGFGKDTIELPSKGMGPDETTAYYTGLKMALFDVSDVSNPKEKFKEIIGDRGTDSSLLYDHKALLFSRDKGLLAFPVQLHEIKSKTPIEQSGFPAYGEFTYQGAYVYYIDSQDGFKLRGRISHLTDTDLMKSGYYGYDSSKAVKRILYAGNTLYTLSEAMLKANSMDTLDERSSLTYPAIRSSHPDYAGDSKFMPMPIVTD